MHCPFLRIILRNIIIRDTDEQQKTPSLKFQQLSADTQVVWKEPYSFAKDGKHKEIMKIGCFHREKEHGSSA